MRKDADREHRSVGRRAKHFKNGFWKKEKRPEKKVIIPAGTSDDMKLDITGAFVEGIIMKLKECRSELKKLRGTSLRPVDMRGFKTLADEIFFCAGILQALAEGWYIDLKDAERRMIENADNLREEDEDR